MTAIATNTDRDGRGVSAPVLGVAAALAICLAAVIGLRLQSGGIAVIWPAAGLAVGLMLAASPAGRVAVAVGTLLALIVGNVIEARPPAAAVVFVLGNLVEAVVVIALLDRVAGRPFRFDSPRSVLLFVGVTAAVAAAVGVATAYGLTAVGYVTTGVGAAALTWFTSHAVGILAFAPVAMLVPGLAAGRLPAATGDLVLGAAASALAVTVVGGAAPQSGLAWLVAAALAVPLVWWVLLGSGPRRAAAAIGLVATVTVWQTTASAGLFSGAVGAAQGFLAAVSILFLLLGALRPTSRVPPIPGADAVRNPVLLVLLVPAMLFAATAWWTWLSTASEARLRLAAETATLAEQAQRVLAVQEALLVAVLGRVEDRPIAEIRADRGVQAFLAKLASDTRAVDGILLYDRDSGRLISASTGFPPPDVDLSDREYVAAHRSGAISHVGPLIKARASGVTGFTLSRLDPDSGVVAVALVSLEVFRSDFEDARAGSGDIVRLIRSDGAVLASDPPVDPSDRTTLEPGSAGMALVGGLTGPVVETDPVTGTSRLLDARKVGEHPVWVVHGRDRAAANADFVAALAPFGALAVGATIALYFLTVRLREAADQAAAARLEADAQRAIAGLADRLNLALRSARAGAWEWAPGEPAGTWSPENFDVFGVDPAGGTPTFDHWVSTLVLPEDRDGFRKAVGDALAGPDDSFSFEFRIAHPDHGVRWISSPGRIERDAGGRVTRLIGLNLDITTERTAVEALRRSEERFRLLFEANPNPMWIYDRETLRFLSVNQAAIERYGYTEAEFLSMHIADIRPPEDMPHLQKVIDEMAPRAAAAGTWRHLSRTGETIYADVTAQPVDFNGRPAVSIVVHDVTDRRRAEEALKDSEARFRTMADHAPMMVWTTDAAGRCDFIGASWSEFTGLPVDEGLGEGRLDAVHPDDRTALAAVLTAPATRSAGFSAEYRMRHHADGWRWVLDAAAPRIDGDGRFLGLIGSMVDITRRKSAEDGIQTLLREVNHRSKNLLAVVQAIARTTAASDPQDFVSRFSERLQALAASQDLLVDNMWQGVDFFDLLRAQLGHWRSAIGRRILTSGPPLRLSAAAAQTLGMAIHELGTNAGKYGALSGDTGTVAVDWSVREDDPRGPRVLMTWVESGGPPVEPPTRRGFGSTVVERLVRKGLAADVVLTFAPDGVRWSLDAAAEAVLDGGRIS